MTAEPSPQATPPTSSRAADIARRWWPAVPGVVAGSLIGWFCAYPLTVGGLASLGAPIFAVFAAVLLGAVALIAGALMIWARTSAAGHAILRGTGVAAVTAVVAFVLVPLLGLGYRDRVVLQGVGTMRLDPKGLGDAGEGGAGRAECESVPDTRQVGTVFGMDLGTIRAGGGEGTIRGGVQRMDGASGWSFELLVDGGDIEGMPQPFWQGPVTVTLADDGMSGTAEFGPVSGATDPWPNGWSGTLAWECPAF